MTVLKTKSKVIWILIRGAGCSRNLLQSSSHHEVGIDDPDTFVSNIGVGQPHIHTVPSVAHEAA